MLPGGATPLPIPPPWSDAPIPLPIPRTTAVSLSCCCCTLAVALFRESMSSAFSVMSFSITCREIRTDVWELQIRIQIHIRISVERDELSDHRLRFNHRHKKRGGGGSGSRTISGSIIVGSQPSQGWTPHLGIGLQVGPQSLQAANQQKQPQCRDNNLYMYSPHSSGEVRKAPSRRTNKKGPPSPPPTSGECDCCAVTHLAVRLQLRVVLRQRAALRRGTLGLAGQGGGKGVTSLSYRLYWSAAPEHPVTSYPYKTRNPHLKPTPETHT